MKRVALLISGLFLYNCLFAQTTYKVLSDNESQTTIDIAFDKPTQIPVKTQHGNEFVIKIDKGNSIQLEGSPNLPKIAFSVQIPNQTNSTISVLESDFTDYPNINIAPSKGRISRQIDPATIPFKYGTTYTTNAFFPSKLADLNTPYIVRDFRGQAVILNPVQYNPVTKIMRVYHHMKIQMKYDGISAINTLSTNEYPTSIVDEFDGIYSNHFVNYNSRKTRYTKVIEQGSIMIVCPDTYLSDIAPFVKWKEMKGFKTYLVNADTITGGVSQNSIRNLAKWYYQNKQIAYMIIVGDDGNIPPVTTAMTVAGPSDNAYAYINNGDHYPEFVVGRFSCESSADLQTQISRTLAYEQTPNTSTSWMNTQIGIASNQGPGDDNQYDFEHINLIVDSNKNQYLYQTNIELYDDTSSSSATLTGNDALGDPTSIMLTNAINNGASLINYCGHGGPSGIVTTSFDNGNVPSLTNANQLPFFFVVGCSPGTFTGFTCFAETLQRSRSTSGTPYGTISNFMSSINQYWDEPMEAQDEFNLIMRGGKPSNLKSRLGAMCMDACMAMNDKHDYFSNPNGPLGGSDMTDTWIYFGDPTVSLLTNNSGALSIGYDVHIQQNSTTYEIHCPVDGTTIGLYYQGAYLASSVVSGGIAYFTFPAVTVLDTIYITATKQNYTPASGKVIVVNWPNSTNDISSNNGLKLFPNPTQDVLYIELSSQQIIEEISVQDASGRTVLSTISNSSKHSIDTYSLSNGLYMINVKTKDGIITKPFQKN